MEILLKNCRMLLTQNRERDVVHNFDILVEDGKIKDIAKNIASECSSIDCSRKLAMPALFNSHTHSPMILLRGYNDDKELQSWLSDMWKVEAKMTSSDMYLGALFACMEMAKSGTYCFMDMYFNMEEVAKACHETGLSAFLGYATIDIQGKEKREREITEAMEFTEWLRGRYENITPVLAPHSIYTCSKEILEWTNDFAKKNNLLKTIHLSETEKEVADCMREKDAMPAEYLDKIGFLDDKTVLFHSAFITHEEIAMIARKNAKVVNCPASNMKLATGGAFPLRDFKKAGVQTLLGTDGACSNNSLDMLNEMKFAALLQKWVRRDALASNAQYVLDMATLHPAQAFGLNSGSLEKGKDANIVLMDLDHHSMRPMGNPVSNIIYSATGEAVSDVMVNGKMAVKNRKLVNVDEEKIRDRFEEVVENLMNRSEEN